MPLDLSPIQQELLQQMVDRRGVFTEENTLPDGLKYLNPNPGTYARIVEDTMQTLERGLIAAGLPVLGDDRMANIEGRVAEHVVTCIMSR